MKKVFKDNSYIDIKKINNKVIVTLAAKDINNPQSTINNSIEIDLEEFKKILEGII